jgi:hypothetical protein
MTRFKLVDCLDFIFGRFILVELFSPVALDHATHPHLLDSTFSYLLKNGPDLPTHITHMLPSMLATLMFSRQTSDIGLVEFVTITLSSSHIGPTA